MKYVRPFSVILAAAVICSAGCAQVGSTVDTDEGYFTEIRMSELEYRTFLAKKTSDILGMLVSHAALAENIADGECDKSMEINSATVTIGAIERAYEDISGIGAASGCDMIREKLLDILDSTKEHIAGYKEMLSAKDSITKEEADEYASLFKNDHTALSAF